MEKSAKRRRKLVIGLCNLSQINEIKELKIEVNVWVWKMEKKIMKTRWKKFSFSLLFLLPLPQYSMLYGLVLCHTSNFPLLPASIYCLRPIFLFPFSFCVSWFYFDIEHKEEAAKGYKRREIISIELNIQAHINK